MMLQKGYGHENALIKHDNPAAALSAIGPKAKVTHLETVFSPVLPRQHGQLSSAITDELQRSVAVLTETIHFSQFRIPFPAARLQPCHPRLFLFFTPHRDRSSLAQSSYNLPPHFASTPSHSRMGCAGVGATELLNRLSHRQGGVQCQRRRRTKTHGRASLPG
jgi:hypothetical protein